jgi:hypothetical protein
MRFCLTRAAYLMSNGGVLGGCAVGLPSAAKKSRLDLDVLDGGAEAANYPTQAQRLGLNGAPEALSLNLQFHFRILALKPRPFTLRG